MGEFNMFELSFKHGEMSVVIKYESGSPFSYVFGFGRDKIVSTRCMEMKNGVEVEQFDSLNNFGLKLNELIDVFGYDSVSIVFYILSDNEMKKLLDEIRYDLARPLRYFAWNNN